jgi:hypothetical protein
MQNREGVMKRILFSFVLVLVGSPAFANNCPSYPNTLTNGTTADANQVMANFNTIMNCASFFIGGTSAGSAGAQTLASVSPGVFTLTNGNRVTFIAGFSTTGATALNVASTGSLPVLKKTTSGLATLAANDMVANQVYTVQFDGSQYELLDPIQAAPSPPPSQVIVMPQGRLTLQSHAPVMSTSQSGMTTIYYDCYVGNQVPYFNGTADALDTITNCEVNLPLSTTWVGPSSVFDIWWVHGGANPICIAVGNGGGWAQDAGGSNTSRGTGYTQLDNTTRPYLTNKNTIGNCFNGATNYGSVNPNQATYLGTVATDAGSNGKVSYTFGSPAVGGGAASFGVWNAYNRVITATTVQDSSAQWPASYGLWQPLNVSLNERVTYVVGLVEDGITAVGRDDGTNPAVQNLQPATIEIGYGLGIDSTSAPAVAGFGTTQVDSSTTPVTPSTSTMSANYFGIPGIGLHYVQELQIISPGNTGTFYGGYRNALSVSLRN